MLWRDRLASDFCRSLLMSVLTLLNQRLRGGEWPPQGEANSEHPSCFDSMKFVVFWCRPHTIETVNRTYLGSRSLPLLFPNIILATEAHLPGHALSSRLMPVRGWWSVLWGYINDFFHYHNKITDKSSRRHSRFVTIYHWRGSFTMVGKLWHQRLEAAAHLVSLVRT